MYYLSSENKGADQLRGYREADLRLCFFAFADCWFSHEAAQMPTQKKKKKKKKDGEKIDNQKLPPGTYTQRIYRDPSEQLFPNRWLLSYTAIFDEMSRKRYTDLLN